MDNSARLFDSPATQPYDLSRWVISLGHRQQERWREFQGRVATERIKLHMKKHYEQEARMILNIDHVLGRVDNFLEVVRQGKKKFDITKARNKEEYENMLKEARDLAGNETDQVIHANCTRHSCVKLITEDDCTDWLQGANRNLDLDEEKWLREMEDRKSALSHELKFLQEEVNRLRRIEESLLGKLVRARSAQSKNEKSSEKTTLKGQQGKEEAYDASVTRKEELKGVIQEEFSLHKRTMPVLHLDKQFAESTPKQRWKLSSKLRRRKLPTFGGVVCENTAASIGNDREGTPKTRKEVELANMPLENELPVLPISEVALDAQPSIMQVLTPCQGSVCNCADVPSIMKSLQHSPSPEDTPVQFIESKSASEWDCGKRRSLRNPNLQRAENQRSPLPSPTLSTHTNFLRSRLLSSSENVTTMQELMRDLESILDINLERTRGSSLSCGLSGDHQPSADSVSPSRSQADSCDRHNNMAATETEYSLMKKGMVALDVETDEQKKLPQKAMIRKITSSTRRSRLSNVQPATRVTSKPMQLEVQMSVPSIAAPQRISSGDEVSYHDNRTESGFRSALILHQSDVNLITKPVNNLTEVFCKVDTSSEYEDPLSMQKLPVDDPGIDYLTGLRTILSTIACKLPPTDGSTIVEASHAESRLQHEAASIEQQNYEERRRQETEFYRRFNKSRTDEGFEARFKVQSVQAVRKHFGNPLWTRSCGGVRTARYHVQQREDLQNYNPEPNKANCQAREKAAACRSELVEKIKAEIKRLAKSQHLVSG